MNASGRVAGFLGRVMTPAGAVAGTCFQAAPGVLVTAYHVLDQIGAGEPGAGVHIEPLAMRVGEGMFSAMVIRTDPVHDLAILSFDGTGLGAAIAGLAESGTVMRGTAIVVTGVPQVEDVHSYRDWDAPGVWAGGSTRDDLPWAQLTCNGVMRGMSGAPVLLEPDATTVVGVVTGRLNTADGWARDRVWAARVEDLLPLLEGFATPPVRRGRGSAFALATLAIDDGWVSFACQGLTASAPLGGMPNPLQGEVGEQLVRLLTRVRAEHRVLRIGVQAPPSQRSRLSWEAMNLPGGNAAGMDANVELFRLAPEAPALAASAGPLRVLVAVSAPLAGGSGAFDYERDLRNIVAAVRGARASGRAHVDVVPFATTNEIRHALQVRYRAGAPVHVLHLSGQGGPGGFEFEDQHGNARCLGAQQFMDEAVPAGMTPPVVVLSARHMDASFEAGLLARGVSVVIATETAITDVYATRVFARLYQNLATGEADIVSAVTTARQAVQRELAASADDRDLRLAAQGEWAMLRVTAAPGDTVLIDRRAPAVSVTLPAPADGVLRRGIGEVVGRRREQRRWPQQLLGDSVAGIVIHGLGGIGKTTLADELVRRIHELAPRTLVATLSRTVTAAELIERITRSALGSHHGGPAAGADQTEPIAVRLESLRRFLDSIDTVMLVVLDNFEDNLTGPATGDRRLASPDLAAALAALTEAADRIKLLITCRYRFSLPDNAHHTLAFQPLGPLSAAETAKLSWTLPHLDRLDRTDLTMVWQTVGGHPRSLEYVDALLGAGRSRFPDIRKRLLATATEHLTAHGHDPAAYFDQHTTLDAALAETITLTADDLLLTELLNDLAAIPHARKVLFAASFYRRPVDINAVQFQLGVVEPELAEADHQRRVQVLMRLHGLLTAAGVTGPISSAPPPIRTQAEALLAEQLPRAPIPMPENLEPAIRACAASSLLTRTGHGAAATLRVAPASATALHHLLNTRGGIDILRSGHVRAGIFWEWRFTVWPHDDRTDALDDLLEAYHHLDLAVRLGYHQTDDLAKVAVTLQDMLSEAGRLTEALPYAEHAERLYRHLATTDPAKFLPDLAGTLSSLGIRLSKLQRHEQALTATEEAVTLRRQLAATDPDAHLPGLAAALNNLGLRLSVLQRHEEALTATEEAVTLRRRLATANAHTYLSDLSTTLGNFGEILSNVGRRKEALSANEEAVRICRELAAINPDAHLPVLARSLGNLGNRLSDLGRPQQALAATDEAITIYRRLTTINPDVHLPDLAISLHNLGIRLSDLGRPQQALAATDEAITIYRQLTTTNPDSYLPSLARSLWALGVIAESHGEPTAEAIAGAREAVQIYERLADQLPALHGPYLQAAVKTVAALQGDDAGGRQ